MASVQHPSPNRWVVHLASRTDPDSEVTVELRMSKATADKLAHLEAARIAALDPDTPCSTTEDVGSAVLTILTSMAAIARVKLVFDSEEFKLIVKQWVSGHTKSLGTTYRRSSQFE